MSEDSNTNDDIDLTAASDPPDTQADPSDTEDLGNSAQGIRRVLPHLPRRGVVWKKLRWVLLRSLALLGGMVFLLLLMTASAAWYTSRPEFCRSCHIMEPYFVSWQESSHKDVACVKCHFAPGALEKARGKMLGLVQLAKYVTASEGPRPAAEIPDASCLRSGCHETRLLSGRVDFHGIAFDHAPHLEKLRRGKKLRCTSCHSQIVQGTHMAVTTSTCFLCHFKEGFFNQGLGACTRCHQIPDKVFDLGGGVAFTHELAYDRGVDCLNCHGDLIRGAGEVPHERCQVCHNRPEDLRQIDDADFMHKNHVTDHKVDCLDCHLEIEHTLEKDKLAAAAADCAACHPSHHQEQLDMLQGVGGETIFLQEGGMLATRVDCRSCHLEREQSLTGTVLVRASHKVCTTCHDDSEAGRLRDYHEKLRALLGGIEFDVQRASDAVKLSQLDEDRKTAIEAELKSLQHDLVFLQVANGIHNIHYASTLTRTLVEKLSALCRELQIKEPDARLPQVLNFNRRQRDRHEQADLNDRRQRADKS